MSHTANRHERRRTESALRLAIERWAPHQEKFFTATAGTDGLFLVVNLGLAARGVATGNLPRAALDDSIDLVRRAFDLPEKAVLAFVAFQIAYFEHANSLRQTKSGEAADRNDKKGPTVVDDVMRIVRERRP